MQLVDEKYSHLNKFVRAQIEHSPEQLKFFTRRLQDLSQSDLVALEEIAGHIDNLVKDDFDAHIADYAWLCNEQINEELHFRRFGKYRLNSFQEAYDQVYSNKEYMTRYMNGLLMTQMWWSNHTKVMEFYKSGFLATNPDGYSHLEIGPGHGLFLYFAASDPRSGEVHSWDISEASVAMTRGALHKLGLRKMPNLQLTDMFKEPSGSFDSVVFSEVLEHMEHPGDALDVLRSVLSPRGRLFINMPINSPAPDHLFNAESPEALGDFIESFGLRIVDRQMFPATNQTLEAARRKKLTISCVYVAERAG